MLDVRALRFHNGTASRRTEAPGKPRRRLAGNVDKDVQIAIESVFAPSHRAENLDIACAVPGSDAQDLVATIFYL